MSVCGTFGRFWACSHLKCTDEVKVLFGSFAVNLKLLLKWRRWCLFPTEGENPRDVCVRVAGGVQRKRTLVFHRWVCCSRHAAVAVLPHCDANGAFVSCSLSVFVCPQEVRSALTCFLTAGIKGTAWASWRRTTTPPSTSLETRPNLWVRKLCHVTPHGGRISAAGKRWPVGSKSRSWKHLFHYSWNTAGSSSKLNTAAPVVSSRGSSESAPVLNELFTARDQRKKSIDSFCHHKVCAGGGNNR